MLQVRFFVPARLCGALDVVVGDAIVCCGYDFSYPQGCAEHLMSWLGMLSYVMGTNFHTRKAVVVCDVVVGDAIVCYGYEFSYPQGGGSA